jgi:exopolysaccharide biosynthesis protein
MPDGTLKCYQPGQTDAAKLQALGVRDSFSFGPLLVEDKKVAYVDDGKDLSTGRVGFGYSDPYHYIVIVALRERHTALSWVRMSNIFVSFGARVAYNLDGGHSSSLVFMGYELSTVPTRSHGRFTNIRGLSDIVMFLENPSVQPRE